MSFLLRLLRSNSPPANPPSIADPLPAIVPPPPLAWPQLFKPVIFDIGSERMLALHLRNERELARVGIEEPQRWARHCRYDSMAIVILTHLANAGIDRLPVKDDVRLRLLSKLGDPKNLDVDRWNTGVLVLRQLPALDGRPAFERTSLSGLGSRSTSRLVDSAELRLHLTLSSRAR